MKKLLLSIICFTLCLTFLALPVCAQREDIGAVPSNYQMVLMENSMIGIYSGELEKLNCSPIAAEGALLLPARWFFQKQGYEVSYSDGVCTFAKDGKSVGATQGSAEITVDGTAHTLKAPVQNIGGNLYIPSDICDVLGLNYKHGANGLFVIYTGEYKTASDRTLIKLQGVYMSPEGAVTSEGTPNKPINNLPAAVEIAKNNMVMFGSEYPVYIFVKGGEYKIKEATNLDQSVFGKSEYKGLNIVGYDGEAVFTGATEINAEDFKPVTDADTLSRLPKAGRGKVAYLDLSTQGISGLSKSDESYPYVYVNDKQQLMSRWPNDDFTKVSSVPVNGEFCYEEANPSRWTRANDLRINGYFVADYFYNSTRTGGVDAKSKRIKTLDVSFQSHRAGSRWYGCNLLEEIDVPGEWYVDRDTNMLYFYPPYTLKGAKVEVCTFHSGNFLNATGVKNLTVDGITVTKIGKNAVVGNDMENVTVKNCNFTFLQGTYNIAGQRCKNITVDGNYSYNCGGGFVSVRTGDMAAMEYGNFKFTNNRIVAGGFVPTNISGAFNAGYNNNDWVGTMGADISNNIIQDCNGSYAVSYVGLDNKVHHNEIINQAKNIHDGGAIYFGKSTSYNGTEISFNYIHHLNRENFYCGLYNDDAYAWANWHHNVVYNANRSAIIGLGFGMKYQYNLAIDTVNPATVGSRMTWKQDPKQKGEVERAAANEKWVAKWPWLKTAATRDPFLAPWDSYVFGNIGIGAPATAGTVDELSKYGAKTIERNGKEYNIEGKNSTKEGNPSYAYDENLFEDPKTQNWNLKPESDIAKEWPEFLDIKMEEIGLSEGYDRLKHIDDTFKLRYPYNGQTNVQTKEVRFSWEALECATEYKLVVATDPELQNVVFEKTLRENSDNNSYTTDSLLNDTVYYWKVYAIGLARQDMFEQGSVGAPYAFKTARENELDKDSIKVAYEALIALDKEIKESDCEYTDEFMKNLEELVTRATDLYKNSKSQSELDALEEEIYNFIKRSPFFVEVNFSVPDFLTNPNAEWDAGGGTVTYNGNTMTYSSPQGTRTDGIVKTGTYNDILCFQAKFDKFIDGGGYQGIDYKMEENTSNSYLFILKENVFEFQKEGKFFLELPSFKVKAGEWIDCMMGAVNTPGGVLQFVSLDGNVVFAALDQTPTQVKTGGRFRIRKNGENDIHLRPMEKIPEKHALIEDIYNSFSNPYDETHLAVLLTGAFNAIDMDNSNFASLDKKKLSEKLYPLLKENGIKIKGTDYSEYKNVVSDMAVLEYYNQGKADALFKNNVVFRHNDVTQFEKIDQNGVNLYAFSQKKFKDSDHNSVNQATMNGNCKNFDELRFRYAKNIFTHSINSCSNGWGADATYMFDIITKANCDYLGINIDDYFALSDTDKVAIHNILGRNGVSMQRTLDEIVEEIHTSIKELK